ncbi:amidase [Blastococcus tunisiensis]|uniref:Amidase n=1 Tax=Blastococcus tunisiensis TaxID=1798228 RepID=A0A1I2GED0_9ACTN|nr:amidase [Blastococcus sp. DSM 46838]SFF15553.1 amidase [Blastococcus sp. DSM 46838]
MSDELWRKGAGELAGMIGSGAVSSVEVVEAHLARIEAVNPALNAVVVVLADQALEAAKLADQRTAAGNGDLGPLHGVPVTIKENIDVAGTATTNGVPALAEAVAPVDAPVVERLRAAGAIVIGRTNLPDMALRISTDSSLRGLTRNPWHADRTAGGSSGGEASALASGMSPLGAGNDIGGSLRNPAHCCGVSSIKPTPGRVPHATVIAPEDGPLSFQMMMVNGPMARDLGDVRMALEIMSGPDRRDPECLPVPLSYPDSGRPVRVALLAEPPGGSTDAGIADVVRQAGAHLAAAGYEVEEVTPPEYETAVDLWRDFLFTEIRTLQPLLEQVMGADGKGFLTGVLRDHPRLDVDAYVQMFVRRRQVARRWAEFLEDYPVVLTPVWAQPAFPHGWDVASDEQADAAIELLRPVMPANLLGLPSAATPGGLADGMPVGVQCMAAPFREDRALDAAAAIQAAVGALTPVDPFVNG